MYHHVGRKWLFGHQTRVGHTQTLKNFNLTLIFYFIFQQCRCVFILKCLTTGKLLKWSHNFRHPSSSLCIYFFFMTRKCLIVAILFQWSYFATSRSYRTLYRMYIPLLVLISSNKLLKKKCMYALLMFLVLFLHAKNDKNIPNVYQMSLLCCYVLNCWFHLSV